MGQHCGEYTDHRLAYQKTYQSRGVKSDNDNDNKYSGKYDDDDDDDDGGDNDDDDNKK